MVSTEVVMNNDIYSMYPSVFAMTKFNVTMEYEPDQKQKYLVRVIGSNWSQIEEMKEWVTASFGPKKLNWYNPRWTQAGYSWWRFKYEKDAAFFLLRWS